MFFYRAWAGNEGRYPQSAVSSPDFFTTQFAYHRWGYATLLVLTLVACVILNLFFLASFFVNFGKQKLMPHILFLLLSVRDLLVPILRKKISKYLKSLRKMYPIKFYQYL
jgi:hypothetical protein